MAKEKVKNEVAVKVETYFNDNPKKRQVYSTPDGYLFETKKFANDHAQTLGEDQYAQTHKNTAFIADVEEEETDSEE